MKRINLVLLGVLVLFILVGGFFWLRREGKVKVPISEPSQNNQTSTKTFESVVGEGDSVWFPVPELGIEIKVKKDIAPELMYRAVLGSDIASVGFTTKKLLSIGENRGLGKEDNGGYACSIGGFTRYNDLTLTDLEKEENEYIEARGVFVNGVFIVYGSPQASCTYGSNDKGFNVSDREYEQYVISNWWKPNSENLKESLQQSIRKLK